MNLHFWTILFKLNHTFLKLLNYILWHLLRDIWGQSMKQRNVKIDEIMWDGEMPKQLTHSCTVQFDLKVACLLEIVFYLACSATVRRGVSGVCNLNFDTFHKRRIEWKHSDIEAAGIERYFNIQWWASALQNKSINCQVAKNRLCTKTK